MQAKLAKPLLLVVAHVSCVLGDAVRVLRPPHLPRDITSAVNKNDLGGAETWMKMEMMAIGDHVFDGMRTGDEVAAPRSISCDNVGRGDPATPETGAAEAAASVEGSLNGYVGWCLWNRCSMWRQGIM